VECGPVDRHRHVFRCGACRHRHHPAQAPVGQAMFVWRARP
jgi:hypothetical protein